MPMVVALESTSWLPFTLLVLLPLMVLLLLLLHAFAAAADDVDGGSRYSCCTKL